MTTTTATRYGAEFGHDVQIDAILSYINGGDYTADQQDALADALMSELRDGVDDRLPEGVTWQPATSEFIHPLDAEMPAPHEMDDLFRTAWEAVVARFAEIEAETLPVLPIRAIIDELTDEPIERAAAAGRLVDYARSAQDMFAAVRREAIHTATRTMTYAKVAEQLGVSESAVNKAVSEHRRGA